MNIYTDSETDKYERAVDIPRYHVTSPGHDLIHTFAKISGCRSGETLIDFGCGPGKASRDLASEYGLKVSMFDLTPDALVDDCKHLPFYKGSLWRDLPGPAKYGYCCDVMEHLPEEFCLLAIKNMLEQCEYVFMNISNVPENFGPSVGEIFHLTVQSYVWWRDHLREICEVIEARDLLLSTIFYVKAFDA